MLSAEQRLVNLRDMIASTGWSILMEEVKEEMESIRDDLLTIPSWDKLLAERGRYDALSQFATMEYLLDKAEEEDKEYDDAAV